MGSAKRAIAQSVAGVKLPPRRRYKPTKWAVLLFTLEGRIPSKKNERIPARNTAAMHRLMKANYGKPLTPELEKKIFAVSKPFLRDSEEFKAWEAEKCHELALQAAKWLESHKRQGLKYPIKHCRVNVYHWWKNRIVRDNTSKMETLNDMFVKIGVLDDDSFRCRRGGTDEADSYRGEILDNITEITITAYEW